MNFAARIHRQCAIGSEHRKVVSRLILVLEVDDRELVVRVRLNSEQNILVCNNTNPDLAPCYHTESNLIRSCRTAARINNLRFLSQNACLSPSLVDTFKDVLYDQLV